MLKYTDTQVTFSEIPDEITLCINISGCQNNCDGCHSPQLRKDIGEPLYLETLYELIDKNEGITCIVFMGGDREPEYINILAKCIKDLYDIKIGWYSGKQQLSSKIDLQYFDFVKLGPYIKERGPLNYRTTNQALFKVVHQDSNRLTDITYKFWK